MRNLFKTLENKCLGIFGKLSKYQTLISYTFLFCVLSVQMGSIKAQKCNCTYNFGSGPSSTSLWSSSG